VRSSPRRRALLRIDRRPCDFLLLAERTWVEMSDAFTASVPDSPRSDRSVHLRAITGSPVLHRAGSLHRGMAGSWYM